MTIADGARVISDLAVLRDQGKLFGPVTSDPPRQRPTTANHPDPDHLALD